MIITALIFMLATPAMAQGYDDQVSTPREDRYNAYDERGEWQPGKQYSTPRQDRYNTDEERGYRDGDQRTDSRRDRDETYEERRERYR